MPPFLAGREAQQRAVLNRLDAIQAGNGLEDDLVFCGPRGNGKTAMLLWIRAEAQARGIRAVIVSAGRVMAEQDLVAKLAERRRWIDRLGSILWMGLQRSSPAGQTQTLEEALGKQLRKAPLALLIDEAHILDVGVGLSLLSTVQELRGQGAPLLIVLAGTPGLPERLDAMQATFWERSEILPFERLQARDAGDAIRVLFEAAERTIGSDALGGCC